MPLRSRTTFSHFFMLALLAQSHVAVTGCIIGSLLGGFFLRGYKKWPMYIGGGIGFGMAYINCEHSLNTYLLAMDPKICPIKKQP